MTMETVCWMNEKWTHDERTVNSLWTVNASERWTLNRKLWTMNTRWTPAKRTVNGRWANVERTQKWERWAFQGQCNSFRRQDFIYKKVKANKTHTQNKINKNHSVALNFMSFLLQWFPWYIGLVIDMTYAFCTTFAHLLVFWIINLSFFILASYS